MVTFFKLYYEHFLFLFYISESNKFCFYLSYTMFKMKLSSEYLIQTYECKQTIIQPVFIYNILVILTITCLLCKISF